jgi:acetoin utilization protein AcuB
MLAYELINNNVPRLQLQDTVAKALQLLHDYKITNLAVVADDVFLGLISEDDLLDNEDEKLPLETLQHSFLKVSIPKTEHFLAAVNSCIQYDTSLVAITSKKGEIFEGVVTITELLKQLGNFAGANELGGIVVLEMNNTQFSISEISRIVESNNCTVLHLNTTRNPLTGILTVTLHINTKEIAAVVATFERYEYSVIQTYGNQNFESEIDTNYKNLMNYLNI